MRWDADNAEALMALEALTQSGQWDLYWQSQLRPTRGGESDAGADVRRLSKRGASAGREAGAQRVQ